MPPPPPPVSVVSRLDVFKETPPEAVEELLRIAPLVPLAPSQVVFRQGEVISRDALLVLTGRLSVFVEAGGVRKAMADVWPGEFVGEAGLFSRANERTATVVAGGYGYALKVSRAFLAENGDQPAVVALEQHLVHTMARRIAQTNNTLQRVLHEQKSEAPGGEAAERPERPAKQERLTLAQRVARWFNMGESE